ncbi:MAG: tetratricopeptide repeat protein [Planctomycetes bacterium]|nr:tetratricopeptide repeat protein [Planctomycetota bacterium]
MNIRRTQLQTRARRSLAPILALATLVLPGFSAASAPSGPQSKTDVIKLRKDNTEESGRIKSEEYGGLTFDPEKGTPHTVAWGDVAQITYQGGEDLDKARSLVDQGNLEEAQTKLNELLKPEAKLRGMLKQHVLYLLATVENRLGKPDDALEGYKALLKEYPKSRYLPEVAEGLVWAYSAKNDLTGAGKALEDLNSGAITAGVEANFSAVIAIQRGQILERQQKWSEAFSAYNAAQSTSGVTSLASQQARLGQARCQLQQKKVSDAQTIFRKISGEDAPNSILAGAWNGLGDIAKAEGRDKRDAAVLLDALYMYLRGVVQYGPVPGESSSEYERALAGAAECFDNLSQVESNKELKARYARSAVERRAQLQKEYPNSPFLTK